MHTGNNFLIHDNIPLGAAVNTGHYNGLEAKVKSKYPQALFTICYAHKLNLR